MKQFSMATWKSSLAFRLLLGCLLSGLALYTLRNIPYQDVVNSLARANGVYVGLALASVAVNTLGKAIRWQVLVGTAGRGIGLLKMLTVLLIGQMLNTLTPGRIGDFTRAYVIGGMGPGRAFVLGTIVVEKFFDMLSYALLVLFLIILSVFLLISLPIEIHQSVPVLLVFTLFFISVIIGLISYHHQIFRLLERWSTWIPAHIRAAILPHVQSGLSSLEILRDRSDTTKLISWSVLIWGTAILTNYLTFFALGMQDHVPPIAALVVLILLQIGISLPSLPGKIGVFQVACILALEVFGVEQAEALSYGILLHLIVLLPTTLIGIILFWIASFSERQMYQDRLSYANKSE